MLTMVLRCIIIYAIVLLVIRVMGKRQIAQMQPFDVVITLIIADIATIPMSDLTIPLLNSILPLFILTILHFGLTFLSCKNIKVRNFVNGTAIILVGPNGIVENNVKSLNMTIADILEACRYEGYLSLDDVLYVIMETNGNISIIPKSASSEVTKSDLNIQTPDSPLPYLLISDGKVASNNLFRFELSEKELSEFLAKRKSKIKDVVIMQYSKDGKVFLQTKKGGKDVFFEKLGIVKNNKTEVENES